MNIFIFDALDQANNAKLHPNKLVCKMQLEAVQILAAALHHHDPSATIPKLDGTPYKITHVNHPCTKWARLTRTNFAWVCGYALALADEYEFRYGKVSNYRPTIQAALDQYKILPAGPLTPFAIAINDFYLQCMLQDGTMTQHEYNMLIEHDKVAVAHIAQRLYCAYLVLAKSHYADWVNQDVPDFWPRQDGNGRLFCKLKKHVNSDLVPFDSSPIEQNAKELEFNAILDANKEACDRFGIPKLSKRKLLEAFAEGYDCYDMLDMHIVHRTTAKPKKTRSASTTKSIPADVRVPSLDEIDSCQNLDVLREAMKGWLGNRKVPTAKSLAKWADKANGSRATFNARVLEHIEYWSVH